jgi:hypothetical protein
MISLRKKIQRNRLDCLLGPLWETLRRAIGDPDLPIAGAIGDPGRSLPQNLHAAPLVTLQ